jgi:catechol 2,3-dioxygenase-like lactoylglutathione lyase family enzyme
MARVGATNEGSAMFERYSFVAVTTTDLARAKHFWSEQLGFAVTEERAGHHIIVDAGGLRLCLDLPDGDHHKTSGADPVIGLKVASLEKALAALRQRGVEPTEGPVVGHRGAYAVLRDPDGRSVVVTEAD